MTEVAGGGGSGKRMVFFDIEADRFRWRWERSVDGGAAWESLWTIDYRRATDGA